MFLIVRNSNKEVECVTQWQEYQKRARTSQCFKGYKVKKQKTTKTGTKRPDFVGISKRNSSKRIVGDAKRVKVLTPQHVNQVKSYKKCFAAQKGVIIVTKTTKVSRKVRNMARNSNIKITRKRARRKLVT